MKKMMFFLMGFMIMLMGWNWNKDQCCSKWKGTTTLKIDDDVLVHVRRETETVLRSEMSVKKDGGEW